MEKKTWQQLASKAKEIAKRIVNGDEEDYKGERLIHIVERLDIFASDVLNQKYANGGSKGSIHTYAGGNQAINTKHADGSEGSFNSNGDNKPTNNPMDIEIEDYINRTLDESKTNRNMKKNVVKINENTLRQIVAESVEKVLNESLAEIEEPEFYNSKTKNHGIQAIIQHLIQAYDAINASMSSHESELMNDDDWKLNSIRGLVHKALMGLREM